MIELNTKTSIKKLKQKAWSGMDKKFYLILLTVLSIAATVFAAGCASNPNQAPPNASVTNDSGQQAAANSSSPGTMFGNHGIANDIGKLKIENSSMKNNSSSSVETLNETSVTNNSSSVVPSGKLWINGSVCKNMTNGTPNRF